ncbi:hypothetical protein YO5_05274 [Stutzerimonas stutzeri TS44]|nr:hypothetical protein YO5_05274 [Stutzerimonas stutzeri TS44]
MLSKRRRSFTGFILLSLMLIGFSVHLLLKSEIQRWETRFAQQVNNVASRVHNHLETNEAVLAGFSAFLQAVEQNDGEAAARYASAVVAAYPQIYMLEVASRVAQDEQDAVVELLRHTWRKDFQLRDFPLQPGQTEPVRLPSGETWPVLFMYPSQPQSGAIYGIRLETVGYLASALQIAREQDRSIASPVFSMLEGGDAYLLLRPVERPVRTPSAQPNLFGNSMVALLLIRTQSLRDIAHNASTDPHLRIEASLHAPGGTSQLFASGPVRTGTLDALLPRLHERIALASQSQPTTLQFERQLHLDDVLTRETLTLLAILAATLVLTPTVLVRHFRRIERSAREHERSAYLATHDALTALPNRHLLTARFGEACAYHQRHGTPFALMIIDLDHFKEINDQLGHEIGDQVLQAVAQRMLHASRPYDTVARYGGDEFVVLLRDMTRPEHALSAGQSLLRAISAPIVTDAGEQTIACSIGIALYPAHGATFETLLNAADHAMYRVKQSGRNGVALSGAGD